MVEIRQLLICGDLLLIAFNFIILHKIKQKVAIPDITVCFSVTTQFTITVHIFDKPIQSGYTKMTLINQTNKRKICSPLAFQLRQNMQNIILPFATFIFLIAT